MADAKKLIPFILKWEGGFCNVKDDRGGATNMGVTLKTWKACGYDKDHDGDIDVQDLKLITKDDVYSRVFKPMCWDKFKADNINSQSVANICVDWAWHSGAGTAIKKVQRVLCVTADGICGPKTLAAINAANPRTLFFAIKSSRLKFLENIAAANNTQKKFLAGWRNRVNHIHFED